MLFSLENITKTYGPITALRQLSVTAPVGATAIYEDFGLGSTRRRACRDIQSPTSAGRRR